MAINALPKVCSNVEQIQHAFFDGGGRSMVKCHPSLVEDHLLSDRLSYARIQTQAANAHTRVQMALDTRAIGNASHFGKMLAAFSSHAMESRLLKTIQHERAWERHLSDAAFRVWNLCKSDVNQDGRNLATHLFGYTGEFVSRTLMNQLFRCIPSLREHVSTIFLEQGQTLKLATAFKVTGTPDNSILLHRRKKMNEYDHFLVHGDYPDAFWFMDTTVSTDHLRRKQERDQNLLSGLQSALNRETRNENAAKAPEVSLFYLHIGESGPSSRPIPQSGMDHSILVQMPLLTETVRLTRETLEAIGQRELVQYFAS